MYMKGRPERAKNLDKVVVDQTIKCFEDLIKSALEVGGRSRFRTIKQIAGQAEMLISMTGDRVGDHPPAQVPGMGLIINGGLGDNNYTYDDGDDVEGVGGYVHGAVLQGQRVGQDDVMRQLVDAIGPAMEMISGRGKLDARKDLTIELDYLMGSREKIATSTVADKDEMLKKLDGRISTVLAKISKEDDDAVVPAKLLRGHQADGQLDEQGPEDVAVLGAPQPVGEEGPGGSSRQGGEEALGSSD